jgi:hypothetical protein
MFNYITIGQIWQSSNFISHHHNQCAFTALLTPWVLSILRFFFTMMLIFISLRINVTEQIFMCLLPFLYHIQRYICWDYMSSVKILILYIDNIYTYICNIFPLIYVCRNHCTLLDVICKQLPQHIACVLFMTCVLFIPFQEQKFLILMMSKINSFLYLFGHHKKCGLTQGHIDFYFVFFRNTFNLQFG